VLRGGRENPLQPVQTQRPNELTAKYSGSQLDAKLWEINQRALDGPIAQKIPFKYSLSGPDPATDNAVIAALRAGQSLETIADNYFGGIIPARLREVKYLIDSGFELIEGTSSVLRWVRP
jgi:hypothetical protein